MLTAKKIRWEKHHEIDRLLKSELVPRDCHWVLELIGRRTVGNPRFKIKAVDLYAEHFKIDKKISPPTRPDLKKQVTDVIAKTKASLTNIYKHHPEFADQSVFQLLVTPGNTKKTGIRMVFRKPRRPERRHTAEITQTSDQIAVGFWRRLVDFKMSRKVLVIYDAPDLGVKDLPPGSWSGSGDVAAAFYLGFILSKFSTSVEALRWQDIRHADLMDEHRCLLLLGDSAHYWLNDRLRTREEWAKRRSFNFERHNSRPGFAAIRDTRESSQSNSCLYVHSRNQDGSGETGYALIFSCQDSAHTQTIFGLMGTSSGCTRAAAWFMSNKDHLEELQSVLAPQMSADLRPCALEVLLQISLQDEIHKGISLLDSLIYST